VLAAIGVEPGALPAEALLAKAAEAAAERGAAPASRHLDDVLIAVAKAEWLALSPRLDSF
jgi:hypothetical protein